MHSKCILTFERRGGSLSINVLIPHINWPLDFYLKSGVFCVSKCIALERLCKRNIIKPIKSVTSAVMLSHSVLSLCCYMYDIEVSYIAVKGDGFITMCPSFLEGHQG